MSLPPAILDKVRTLLLISLGSDAEGERTAASEALKRLLKNNGLDLHDMAGALVEAAPPPAPPPASPPPEPRIREHGDGRYEIPASDLVVLVDTIRAGGMLDDYAAGFLDSMDERAATWRLVLLSEKQLNYLTRLLNEVPQ